jgi:hypothetical protein
VVSVLYINDLVRDKVICCCKNQGSIDALGVICYIVIQGASIALDENDFPLL